MLATFLIKISHGSHMIDHMIATIHFLLTDLSMTEYPLVEWQHTDMVDPSAGRTRGGSHSSNKPYAIFQ